jgi:hypothetical protein
VRCSLSKFSIRSVLSASAVHVRAILAHAILIGSERASRARRLHSFELDRHSVAESIGHRLHIGCQVHTPILALPRLPWPPQGLAKQLGEALLADLYADWLEHGAEAIRQVREERPADYLKIVAMIVSKCEDLSLDSEMRDAAMEQFIEERRQQALKMIAKMRETPPLADD